MISPLRKLVFNHSFPVGRDALGTPRNLCRCCSGRKTPVGRIKFHGRTQFVLQIIVHFFHHNQENFLIVRTTGKVGGKRKPPWGMIAVEPIGSSKSLLSAILTQGPKGASFYLPSFVRSRKRVDILLQRQLLV